jgi:hypothetical protein
MRGVTSQKIIPYIVTALRTSDVAELLMLTAVKILMIWEI